MKNGMREDLLLTKRDYLLYLGIRTDEKKKKSSPGCKERNRTPGMKKRSRLFFGAFLCFALVFSVFTAFSAFAEDAPGVLASGYCGASGDHTRMTWTLTEDGELTISGTGYMWVDIYSEVAESLAETPWKPYRDSIRRLVIEEGVQTISYAAFRDCTALTEVFLPESLLSVATRTFKGCTALTAVHFPENLKYINSEMFTGCTSLERVTLPESVERIYAKAFSGCVSLAEITMPAHMKYIGDNAFNGCRSLQRIVIPEGVTEVKEDTFLDCIALKNVSLPEGLTTIESGAFANCRSLTEISLPNSLTSIRNSAFSGCSALKEIEIPDTVREINEAAFSRCAALESVILPAGLRTIAPYLFYGCESLQSVTIPESVVWIEVNAFQNCSSVTDISIPANVKTIQQLAFAGMDSLQAFEVSEDNPYFSAGEYGCLYNKDKTTLVSYPGGRAASAFTVPDGVSSIELSAFADLPTLESVTFPASVTDIVRGAFYRCPNIVSFTVDPGNPVLRSVNNCVIEPASDTLVLACKTSEIPDDGSVKHIRGRAFVNTGSSITVPGFIESFEQDVFTGCDMLVSAVIAPGITKTAYGMFPSSVKKIVIPDTVTYIEAFLVRDGRFDSMPTEDFDVYYTGSEEQWNEIHIENWYEAQPNNNLLAASKHFDYRFTEVDGAPSTCAAPGYTAGLYCDVTGTWVSGHKALGLLDHTPGEPVRENEIPAACSVPGGYDEAVYCAVCGAEISRTHSVTPAVGHRWGEWEVVKQATVSEEGLMRRVCLNDPSHTEEETIPKLQPQTSAFQQFIQRIVDFFNDIIDWFRRLFRF